MARDKLKGYHDSYAQAMNKYGLVHGVEGAETRHISTQQYYRDLFVKNENLKENIEILQEQKTDVYEKVRDMYDRKDEAQDKFLTMDKRLHQKEQELAVIEGKLQKAKHNYEPHKAQEELTMIHTLFPMMKEQLRIAELCQKIGFSTDHVSRMFKGNTLSFNSGKLYSPEHDSKFDVSEAKVKIENEPDNPNRLRLNLNGLNILEWFRQKYSEFLQRAGIKDNQNLRRGKGVKL